MSEHKFSTDFTTVTLHDYDYEIVLRALKVLAVELADDYPDDAREVSDLREYLYKSQ